MSKNNNIQVASLPVTSRLSCDNVIQSDNALNDNVNNNDDIKILDEENSNNVNENENIQNNENENDNYQKSDLMETTSKVMGSISRHKDNEDFGSSKMFFNYGPGCRLDNEVRSQHWQNEEFQRSNNFNKDTRQNFNNEKEFNSSGKNYNSFYNSQSQFNQSSNNLAASQVSGYYDYRRSSFKELNPTYKDKSDEKINTGTFTSNPIKQEIPERRNNFERSSPSYSKRINSPSYRYKYVSPNRSLLENDISYNYKSSYEYLYEKYLSPRRYQYRCDLYYRPYSPRLYRNYISPRRYFISPRRYYISPNRILLSPNRVISPKKYTSPLREDLTSQEVFDYRKATKSSNLTYFLSDLLNAETSAEKVKEELSLRVDISIEDLFSIFDIRKVGSISLLDFKNACIELNSYPSMEEIKFLFKRYDRDQDGKLSYNEFSEIFLPFKDEYANLLYSRSRFSSGQISESTVFTIKKLLDTIFGSEKSVDNSRRSLNSRPYFSSYDNFELIKSRLTSYISREDLESFLIRNGLSLSVQEVDLLFRRLDKNRDYQVTFNEFVGELMISE